MDLHGPIGRAALTSAACPLTAVVRTTTGVTAGGERLDVASGQGECLLRGHLLRGILSAEVGHLGEATHGNTLHALRKWHPKCYL